MHESCAPQTNPRKAKKKQINMAMVFGIKSLIFWNMCSDCSFVRQSGCSLNIPNKYEEMTNKIPQILIMTKCILIIVNIPMDQYIAKSCSLNHFRLYYRFHQNLVFTLAVNNNLKLLNIYNMNLRKQSLHI